MSDDKRVVTTKFHLNNPTIRGGQLFGVKAVLAFTVSVDEEQKKLGEFTQITNLTVDFNGVPLQTILADAMAQRKVKWQQKRSDIEELAKLSDGTIKFDYTFGRAPATPMTYESALEYIRNLPPDKQQKAIEDLISGLNPTEEVTE